MRIDLGFRMLGITFKKVMCLSQNAIGSKSTTLEQNLEERRSQKINFANFGTLFFLAILTFEVAGKSWKEKDSLKNLIAADLFSNDICWDGPALFLKQKLETYPKNQTVNLPDYNIRVTGKSCRECTAGFPCKFLINFFSDIYFDKSLSNRREFMVILSGPAVVHAYVSPFSRPHMINLNKGNTYIIEYQIWDSGDYILTADADCSLEAKGQEPRSHRFLKLPIKIKQPSETPPEEPSSPCSIGHDYIGRWVDTRKMVDHRRIGRHLASLKTKYDKVGIAPPPNRPYLEYQAYECVGKFVDLERFPSDLIGKGIREISLVGDSHQRALFNHLQTLIDGNFTGSYHGDEEWFMKDKKYGSSLKLNFYWMEGLFKNGKFGCQRPNKNERDWPIYSNMSDIVILEGSAWTFRFCENPIAAYNHYLPAFMEYILQLPHKETTRFFWRTSPPFPNKSYGCRGFVGNRRSSIFAQANDIARMFSQKYRIEFMNFWPIEAARYADTCLREIRPGIWSKDTHYSCLYANNSKVYGIVGEMVARTFVHILATLPHV